MLALSQSVANPCFSEYGNPGQIPSVYSGIRTGLSLENHLIYRPPLVFNHKEAYSALRTIYTDSKWLNGMRLSVHRGI